MTVMVLNILMAVVVTFVILSITSSVVRAQGGNGVATFIAQVITVGLFAGALAFAEFVSLPVAGGLLAIVVAIRIFAIVWFWHLGKKVLRGDYGQETQWAAELARDEDEEFMRASNQLTQMELREVGLIAESKDELREKTIERANEGE